MNDEERKHAYAGIEEILDILKHNHRNKTSFGNEKGPYGRTLAEGEAAFHALIAISQLPEVKNADDSTIEIPRWVFDALVNTWKIFILIGGSKTKKDRKTLGQVVGCEPNYQGGREGATTSHNTWNELRVAGLARYIKNECIRAGIHASFEDIAGEIATLLESNNYGWPKISEHTIERYRKKYLKTSK